MSKTRPTTRSRISRRTFLKGAGVTAASAAAVVAACAPTSNVAPTVSATQALTAKPVAQAGAGVGTLAKYTVNGTVVETATDPRTTLAELLRDQLGLTGTKIGCFRAECGACTVIVDGRAILSCSTLASDVVGKSVTTVEGLAVGGKMNGLQEAFWEAGGAQCGFCTPGMLMSSTALLAATPKPTEDDVRLALSGNLCRCTGYKKIVEAVLVASGQSPKA